MKRKTKTMIATENTKKTTYYNPILMKNICPKYLYKWVNGALSAEQIAEKGGIVEASKIVDIDTLAPSRGFFNERMPA